MITSVGTSTRSCIYSPFRQDYLKQLIKLLQQTLCVYMCACVGSANITCTSKIVLTTHSICAVCQVIVTDIHPLRFLITSYQCGGSGTSMCIVQHNSHIIFCVEKLGDVMKLTIEEFSALLQ